MYFENQTDPLSDKRKHNALCTVTKAQINDFFSFIFSMESLHHKEGTDMALQSLSTDQSFSDSSLSAEKYTE